MRNRALLCPLKVNEEKAKSAIWHIALSVVTEFEVTKLQEMMD